MANRFKFTHNRLSAIEPGNKRTYYYDTEQPGLRLAVTPKGIKTYQFQMWSPDLGRPLTKTIAKVEKLSIKDARTEAKRLAGDITSGQDIEADRRAKREELTFSVIFDLFIDNHAKAHRSTWPEDKRTFKNHMKKPFGSKRMDWFSTDRVRAWHRKIGEEAGKIIANRALGLLSSVFTHELPEKDNPAKGVRRFPEQSRDRFLQPNELEAFFKALAAEPNRMMVDFFTMLLMTGARKGNLMSMTWGEVDLVNNIWTIPARKAKSGQSMRIPLVPDAVRILTARKQQTSSVFVFPGNGRTGHLVSPKSAWKRIIDRAELKDVRIHDLRRTMGSFMAGGGASTIVIGKALGHNDQAATAIYSRLNLDPVRNAMEQAAAAMLSASQK